MTPQEKAKDMFNKMYDKVEDVEVECSAYCMGGSFDRHIISKQCALIAVDEIINIAYWSFMESGGKQEQEYWQKVKQEIQKS
jgi:hypothetical protein